MKPMLVLVILAFAWLPACLFAGGSGEATPPAIAVEAAAEATISPQSSPDSQDIVYLPLTITASQKMVVKGFRLVVRGEGDRLVRTIEVADTRKPGFFENLFTAIGLKKKIPLEVPGFVVWDGKDDQGRFVAEGRYTCVVEAWDDKGRLGRTQAFAVAVDDTAPKVEVSVPYRIFSPNGDGNQDLLIVEQKGSVEDYWRGVIRDAAGNVLLEQTWESAAPGNLSWNGRDRAGARAPDGRYVYEVASRDKAGNLTVAKVDNIDLDTKVTTAALSRDLGAFSPNGDGSKDVLTLSLDVPVREGIANWRLTVEDASGRVRRAWTGTEQPPPSVVFDGRDDAGAALAEGRYRPRLSVSYTNGNNPTAAAPEVEIDRTPPVASATVDPAIFSPNGDGNKDVLTVRQSSSTEDSWRGEIRDRGGRAVKVFEWRGRVDAEVVWEGRGDDNKPVPDGRYTYVAFATDRAGNFGTSRGVELEKDTSEIPALSLIPDYREFSPNGDGSRDTLAARVGLAVRDGIERYTLVIRGADGRVARRIQKAEAVPESFSWDGRDDAGAASPDGDYFVDLEVVYRNGNTPRVTLGPILLDTVAPKATVSAAYTLFSPDGDGRRDTITIRQTSSDEGLWEGEIRAQGPDGTVVASRFWKGTASDLTWDGKDEEGKTVKDGAYGYSVKSVDRALNQGSAALADIRVDTRPTPVGITAASAGFSPNGDGTADELGLNLYVDVPDGIAGWSLVVRDGSGAAVRTVSGAAGSSPPQRLAWDGRTDAGAAAADGAYGAELSVQYEKGNLAVARTAAAFAVDRIAPRVSATAAYTLFSPDGDGGRDTLPVEQSASVETQWDGRFLDSAGRVVAARSWKGAAGGFAWDGRDDAGKPVADGIYSYVVSATDAGGNIGTARIDGIRIDTRATSATLALDARGFSPNGDGRADELAMTPAVGLSDGISGWSLRIRDAGGTVVRSFSGASTLPARVVWDGRADGGAMAADGTYGAELEVSYEKGNVATARPATPLALDTRAPDLAVTFAPQPFSPDDDGVADTLSISYAATDASGVEAWSVRMLDPQERLFIDWSGRGEPPATITWNGLSPARELVQAAEDYPTVFSATDVYGNTATVRRPIAIDVLVIRDGDRLKIRISSINFAPNSADYQSFDPAAAEKNRKTLDRLAEILKKYPEHQIRIEGHAVSEWWDKPVEAAREQREELIPLSRARADAIRGALVQRGIEGRRITTEGLGGAQPVVPHGDLDNRWKNRRVEFILVRP